MTNGQLVDDDVVGANDDEDDEDFGPWELAPSVGTIPLGSRLWGKVGMDRLFYPFYVNLMVGGGSRRDAFGDMAKQSRAEEDAGATMAMTLPRGGGTSKRSFRAMGIS